MTSKHIIQITTILLTLALTNLANAHSEGPWWNQIGSLFTPDPTEQTPGTCEGENCPPIKKKDCSKGSPIYLATGYLTWQKTDIQLNGRPNLHLTRTYNSHDPRYGIFGQGWHTNCETKLIKVIDHTTDTNNQTHQTTKYLYRIADGRRYQFIKNSDGTITNPPGEQGTITDQPNNQTRLTQLNGSYQQYDESGNTLKIADRHGNEINYAYTDGRLTQIADTNGRHINLTYNTSGFVNTATDHTNRTWTYTDNTTGPTPLTVNLTARQLPTYPKNHRQHRPNNNLQPPIHQHKNNNHTTNNRQNNHRQHHRPNPTNRQLNSKRNNNRRQHHHPMAMGPRQ